MIPLKRSVPLTQAAIEVFSGLRGEARERAIATGNYDELVKREPEREPGSDDEPPQRRGAFDTIDDEVPV